MSKKDYNEWYKFSPLDHFWMKSRFSAFLKTVNKNKIKFNRRQNILDIGCGAGVLAQQLYNKYRIKCDLYDQSSSAFKEYIKSKIPHNNFYNGKLSTLNFKKKYHKIFLFDVIEHLPKKDLKIFFKKISKIICDDGVIIINVPGLQFLYSSYDEEIHHKKRYNKKDLIKLAVKFKYNIKCVEYWGFFFIPLLVFRKIYLLFNKKKIVEKTFKIENKILNYFLYFLYKIETIFNSVLVGTSILCILEQRKNIK
jgi:phospholipid N-methyltransferase